MDPELSALTAALTRLNRDAALARLEIAAGGTTESAAAIMRDGLSGPENDNEPSPHTGEGSHI